MVESRFLTRVALRNYKSIAACDVELHELTFLVGPNGSGKSNFLDALRFVVDALRTSLDHAIRDRGGINEVRRRSAGHPNHFGMRLDFALRSGATGHYAFRIAARERGGYEVQTEECVVTGAEPLSGAAHFLVQDGDVKSSVTPAPAQFSDRLYLVNLSGVPEFRPVYDALANMGFYNLNPDRIRDLQPPDPGELLARDGSNITSVIAQMAHRDPETLRRIEEYLGKVVPDIRGVSVKTMGPKETLEFRQRVGRAKDPWRFLPANMSDGTLRALGILVALFQSKNRSGPAVPIIGIEEPEVALHPGAAGVLFDSLCEASRSAQVIVTSHSPDLLEAESLETDSILAVVQEDGNSHIGPVDDASRTALMDRLFTAGELLRLNQLMPDPRSIPRHDGDQLRLFDSASA